MNWAPASVPSALTPLVLAIFRHDVPVVDALLACEDQRRVFRPQSTVRAACSCAFVGSLHLASKLLQREIAAPKARQHQQIRAALEKGLRFHGLERFDAADVPVVPAATPLPPVSQGPRGRSTSRRFDCSRW